jgi:hypothetical protein
MGFAMFQGRSLSSARGPWGAAAPSSMAQTLRSFSLPDSCTVSPRPVPSRCSSPLPRAFRACCHAFSARFVGSANLRALSRQEVRCELPGVAAKPLLDAPLGFWVLSRCGASGPGCVGRAAGSEELAAGAAALGWWPPRGSPVRGGGGCLGGAGAVGWWPPRGSPVRGGGGADCLCVVPPRRGAARAWRGCSGGCRCLLGGPEGSPVGRWRCRCLCCGPRGGRGVGGGECLGGAGAVWVAPEGVAGRAVAVPIASALSLRGGARRGRGVPLAVPCLPGGPRGGRLSGGAFVVALRGGSPRGRCLGLVAPEGVAGPRRWRCRCRCVVPPRRGAARAGRVPRRCRAVWVAPEGVAGRAVPLWWPSEEGRRAGGALGWWPPRGSPVRGGGAAGCLRGGPRGGRRSGWRVPVRCRSRCRCRLGGPRGGRRSGGGGCLGGAGALGWWPPRGSPVRGGGGADCLCCGPPRRVAARAWRAAAVPVPSGWPPKGSPVGRCLCGGPPRRVAARAVPWAGGPPRRVAGPRRWRCRGGWGQGPVRWRVVRRGAPVGLRRAPVGLRSAPVVPRGVPVGLRRAPVVLRWRRCLQTPVGPARRPPRRVGLLGPWVRLAALRGGWVCWALVRFPAPPRGVGSSGRREGRPVALPRKGGWRSWGARLAGAASPRRGGGAGCVGVSAPRGGWAHVGPRWRCGLSGASPVWSVLPPGFGLPRKVERVHRGKSLSSRLEWPPGGSAEAGLSGPVRSAGAEAPVGVRGSCSVGRPPPRGWAARAASLFRAARGLCGASLRRSAAGPTSLPTEVGRGPVAAEAGRGAAEGPAPKRLALVSLTGRGPGREGASPLGALRQAAGRREGLSSSKSAPGRRASLRQERGFSCSLKRCGHVKEQPEDGPFGEKQPNGPSSGCSLT